MEIEVRWNGPAGDDAALWLDGIAEHLERDCDVRVRRVSGAAERGKKDPGIALALVISAVGATAGVIGALITTLNYWRSREPRCSISLTKGETSITISNLTPEQCSQAAERLAKTSGDLKVLLSKH